MSLNLQAARDYAVEQIKQRLIHEAKKRLAKKAAAIALNPWTWIILLCLALVISVIMLMVIVISSNHQMASELYISEKVVPPQIYVTDLERSITSGFGERTDPFTGVKSVHSGIDIAIPWGTPVMSSFDGVVTTVSFPQPTDAASTKDAGIFVVVQNNEPDVNMSSRYLHLQDALVVPGQRVKKGQVIGLSGSTGRSTGAHLHYEMIPEGEPAVDPSHYIMLMSKLTDAAVGEAKQALRKIPWESMEKTMTPRLPYYESDKMLYLSGVYLETEAPSFSLSGQVDLYKLERYGTRYVGKGSSGSGSSTTPAPPVTVPGNTGNLTHPFFIQYAAAAQAEEARSKIPASITLAQAALESGYGASSICNNMFGIKANASYTGPYCESTTKEEIGGVIHKIIAKFRAYASPEHSFADHSNFLLSNGRYQTALSKSNPFEFANELQRAGYATDSQYANKLKAIIRSQDLSSLDANKGIDAVSGQPFEDVPYSGGSGSGGTNDITFVFGIQQVYGTPAYATIVMSGNDHYTSMIDPIRSTKVINWVNYDRVVDLYKNNRLYDFVDPPDMYIKDVPNAIMVKLQSGSGDELIVSSVQYVKGSY